MKIRHLLFLSACLLIAASAFAQEPGVEPLIGTWIGEWWANSEFDFTQSAGDGWDPALFRRLDRAVPDRNKVTVELKWDGKELKGTVNPGPNAVGLQKVTIWVTKTGAVHFETDTKDQKGNPIHCVIEGQVNKNTMAGSWSHENGRGDFKITKK